MKERFAPSILVLLSLLLETVACHQDQIPQPTTTSITNLTHQEVSEQVPSVTPTSSIATSISLPITATSLPVFSISGGGVVAFHSDRDRQDEVYVMNTDGSSIAQQLTHNAEIDQDRAPSWWPVGTLS